MSIRVREDIEKILLQLNDSKLPFPKYCFSTEAGALKLLGKGGLGYVYEAEKRGGRKRKYAIKVDGFGEKPLSKELSKVMEKQESLAISNENILKVYQYVEIVLWLDVADNIIRAKKIGGDWIVVSEAARKQTLRLRMALMELESPLILTDSYRRKSLSRKELAEYNETEVLRLATDIGHALDELHRNKLLHKDVKLENIFYSERSRRYKLGDFDIAELVKDGTSTVFSGTAGYAAPEILEQKARHDATADLYSLGIVLYLLMNECRFPRAKERFCVNCEVQYKKGFIPPRPKHGSDLLWSIVEKLCMYDADDRYQSAEEMLTDIKQLLYEEKIYFKQRHRRSYPLMGGVLLCLGIFVNRMGDKMPLEAEDIRWIQIALFSLAAILLVYGIELIRTWKRPFEQNRYVNGVYWRNMTRLYIAIAFVGWLHEFSVSKGIVVTGMSTAQDVLYRIALYSNEYDVFRIGLSGTLFCLWWTVRESLLRALRR